jgi:hypothetical protein
VALSDAHRRFLVVEQGAVPTLFNLVLNGVIAWALFRSSSAVPLWGESSFGVDLLATGFLLPFLTCLIVSSLVGHQVRSGRIPVLTPDHLPHFRWYRRSPMARGCTLGAAGVVFGAIPVVWALTLGEAAPVKVWSFVAFKAVWAAMLASIVTPIVAWWALAHASEARAL